MENTRLGTSATAMLEMIPITDLRAFYKYIKTALAISTDNDGVRAPSFTTNGSESILPLCAHSVLATRKEFDTYIVSEKIANASTGSRYSFGSSRLALRPKF